MQDLDCFFGVQAFGHNTGDKLFMEYIPDNYDKNKKSVENFGVVALFDRKSNEEYALSSPNYTSRHFYIYLAKILSECQGNIPCKFFYVIGSNNPPWKMIEIDLSTGHKKTEKYVDSGDWSSIWQELGLCSIRNDVVKWMKSKH